MRALVLLGCVGAALASGAASAVVPDYVKKVEAASEAAKMLPVMWQPTAAELMSATHSRVSEMLQAVFDHRDKVKDVLRKRVAQYRMGYTALKAVATGDHTSRRRLDVLETYGEDLGNMLEDFSDGDIATLDELWDRFQAISCSGNSPRSDLINAIDDTLQEALEDVTDMSFKPPLESAFTCLCSSSWDLSASEYDTLVTRVRALIDGDDSDAAIGNLIASIKDVIPLFMGSKAMCSGDCEQMMTDVVQFGLALLEDALELSLPSEQKTGLPTSFSGCICGGTIGYDVMLDDLFPNGQEFSTIEYVSELFDGDTDHLATLIKRVAKFIDFLLSDQFVCGGTCQAMMSEGTTIGLYAATRALYPDAVEEWLPSASEADLPTTSSIISFAGSMTGCLCSTDRTSFYGYAQIAEPFIEDGIVDPNDNAGEFVDDLETIIVGAFGTSSYGDGFCGEPMCPGMMTDFGVMLSKILERAATEKFEVDDGLGNCRWDLCTDLGSDCCAPSGEPAGCSTPEDGGSYVVNFYGECYGYEDAQYSCCTQERSPEYFQVFSEGMITSSDMDNLFVNTFGCWCSYFTGTENMFPFIRSKVVAYAADPPDDIALAVFETFRQALGVAKVCKSNTCRSLLDKIMEMVELWSSSEMQITYSGDDANPWVYTVQKGSSATSTCSVDTSTKCWVGSSDGCWPLISEPLATQYTGIYTDAACTDEVASIQFEDHSCGFVTPRYAQAWDPSGTGVLPGMYYGAMPYGPGRSVHWCYSNQVEDWSGLSSKEQCEEAVADARDGYLRNEYHNYPNMTFCGFVEWGDYFTGACYPTGHGDYFKVDITRPTVSATTACSACYTPPSSGPDNSDYLVYPLAHFNSIDISRIIYWASCALKQSCPAEDVGAYVVAATFTLSETMETFDDTAQDTFKANYVEMLAPAGSDKEGLITVDDVTLTITEGSINVEASVVTYSEVIKEDVKATIESADTTTMSTALGVTVASVSAPVETVVANSPPPPAPPPSPPPGTIATSGGGGGGGGGGGSGGGDDDDNMGIIIGAAAGGAVVVIVVIIALVCCCKKKGENVASSTTKTPTFVETTAAPTYKAAAPTVDDLSNKPKFDTQTGERIHYDPNTGQRMSFDPQTGQRLGSMNSTNL